MAKWIRFAADYDYHHASRAVTAYKADVDYYQPDHLADPLIESGLAVEVEKPVNRDGKPRSERVTIEDKKPDSDIGDA